MKTFDEAFKVILDKAKTNEKLWMENLDSSNEYINNKRFEEMILVIAMNTMANIGRVPTIDKMLAELCSSLHTAFQVGVITGMEMEKNEDLSKGMGV